MRTTHFLKFKLSACAALASLFFLSTDPNAAALDTSGVSSYSGGSIVGETTSEGTAEPGGGGGAGIFKKLPFTMSTGVLMGYDSNVFTTSFNETGSWFTNFDLNINGTFGNRRTQFVVEGSFGVNYFWDVPQDSWQPVVRLSLGLTHRVSPRLVLSANTFFLYQSNPQIGISSTQPRYSGNYVYSASALQAAYQWTPKISTVASYNLVGLFYEDDGGADLQNFLQHTFGISFRYLVLPTTTAVADYRYQLVRYGNASFQNSDSNFMLVGFDHTFNPRTSLSVRAGLELRDFATGGLAESPYFESTLRYAYAKRSSISWVNRYGFENSNVTAAAEQRVFRTGLIASHSFSPRITGNFSTFYAYNDYDPFVGSAFTQNNIDVSLGVRYEINRAFSVEAGYIYSTVLADQSFNEYNRSRGFVGGRFTF